MELEKIQDYITVIEDVAKKLYLELNEIDPNNKTLASIREEYTDFDEFIEEL